MVYEQGICAPFYHIYEVQKARVEVYNLVHGYYQKILPNEGKRYPIKSLGVELGIWEGKHQSQVWPWLRWWDSQENLLLTGCGLAEQERQRAEPLAEHLKALGVEPELIIQG